MRKSVWLLGTSALALGLGMASPGALAQSQSPVEGVNAEDAAFALVNVDNKSTNDVVEASTVTDNEAVDGGSVRDNTVINSFSLYNGILHLQENNGSSNSINAASAVVADAAGTGVPIGAGAQTNSTTFENETTVGLGSVRTNNVRDSFNGAAGQVIVQQNNGDNNEIGAATAVYGASVTVGNVFQVARANATTNDQTGDGPGDAVFDPGTRRANTINPSFNGANGTMVVQQNNGTANAMSVASSIVGSTGVNGNILQNADANADVSSQVVVDAGSNRNNSILNSFTKAAGEMIVQQNNGDVNAMSIASAVAGVAGDVSGNITQYPDAAASAIEDNDVTDIDALDQGSRRVNTINPSFNGAQGLVSVQQNNGNTNAMAISNAVVGVSGNVGGNVRQLDSEAEDATVEDIIVADDGRSGKNAAAIRNNRILNGSFNNADGQISVQQNNGDANSMGISNAVVAVTGNVGGNVTQDDTDAENSGLADINATAVSDVRSNAITGAFNNVAGVTTVQQNNGSANAINAANSVVAVTGNIGGNLNQTDLEAAESEIPGSVTVDARGSNRDNLINPSFNGYSGVVNVQQNNGDANVLQASSTLAAVTGRVDNILQEVDADGNVVDGVTARDAFNGGINPAATNRSNLLTGSFSNSAGHASVQQNNGSANIMSTAQAVAAGLSGADNVQQTVNVEGTATDSELRDDGSTRNNRIVDSFLNAAGTTSAQQNNGDGNVMSIATAHVALRDVNGGNGANADNSEQSIAVTGTVTDQEFTDDDNTVAFGPRNNVIQGSYNSASGVHNVQQNNGNGNVIGAGLGVLVDMSEGGSADGEDVDLQQTSAVATVMDNDADIDGEGGGLERSNSINSSFGNLRGVATIQQNDGDNNAMGVAVAVRANQNAGDDIDAVYNAQATTNAEVTGNDMTDGNPANQQNIQRNDIASSFGGAQGIVAAQQNTGNNNAINSATGVSANTGSFVPTATAPASSAAVGIANVDDNVVEQGPETDLDNRITGSFNNAATVGSVQQNNGHSNAMGASTQVAADDNSQFGPAVSLAALGSTVTNNTTTIVAPGNTYNNTISGSFNSAQGVMTVQQNNGSNNAIGSAISVVANFTSN